MARVPDLIDNPLTLSLRRGSPCNWHFRVATASEMVDSESVINIGGARSSGSSSQKFLRVEGEAELSAKV